MSGGGSYPAPVERLVAELARLPGIGRRSAERVAFHILKNSAAEAGRLADAIREVKTKVRHCSVCFNFTDDDVCAVCADPRRDAATVLVVEQPRDLLAMEFSGMFRGVYHVLMGRLSPLEGVGPGDLTIAELLRRVREPSANARGQAVSEVILAMNPTLDGDGTALFLAEELRQDRVKLTRLARGLAAGSQLELANKSVLADALEGRRAL
ncbi:MAG: recombination mediator RecR [Planctomycetota bacterium]|nr:recombination mediator RecR [Planctomycetota bacterium]